MAPSDVTIQQVGSPSEELLRAAAQIYVDTMKDDPSLVGATAGRLAEAPRVILSVIRHITLIDGEFYAATDENGQLVGFSAWVPPSSATDVSEEADPAMADFLGSLTSDERDIYLKSVNEDTPKFIDRAMGKPNAEKHSYWCWFAAVRPESQRQGIFQKMLEIVTEKAKAQNATMGFLTSTTTNWQAALAERAGFVVKGHETFTAPWGSWEFRCLAKDTGAA